jgi:hypothetical protein
VPLDVRSPSSRFFVRRPPTRLLEDAAVTDDLAYRGVVWHLVDVAEFDHTMARASHQQNPLGAWVYVIAGNATIGIADLTA